jgi:hypothetical protein
MNTEARLLVFVTLALFTVPVLAQVSRPTLLPPVHSPTAGWTVTLTNLPPRTHELFLGLQMSTNLLSTNWVTISQLVVPANAPSVTWVNLPPPSTSTRGVYFRAVN